MAMITCQECGKEVSNQAQACIHCGLPFTQDQQQNTQQPYQPQHQYSPSIDSQYYQVPYHQQSYQPYIVATAPQQFVQKPRKSVFRRGWFWLVAAVLFVCILTPLLGWSAKEPPDPSQSVQTSGNNASQDSLATTPASPPSVAPKYGEADYKRDAKEIVYSELVRTPEAFIGEKIKIDVKISQIMEGGILREAGYRAYSGKDEWYINYELPSGAPRIINNDYVTFWGEYAGVIEITRAFTGTKDYIPKIVVKYHEITEQKEVTFGDTFFFDDLEITFYPEVEWTKVNNRYSDHNDAVVVRIPITVKNNSPETKRLNPFSYSMFGPDGLTLDRVYYYFDDISSAGDMRSGAEQSGYMHILYKGDGDYYIEFGYLSSDVEVRLTIEK